MFRSISILLAFLLVSGLSGARIKDLTNVQGTRDNQLSGLGLVVGLAGDGDSTLEQTRQVVSNMFERYNISVPQDQIRADNVAVVMVTANIAPFSKPGSRIDVTIASAGDADSLQGGILLQTPLEGADGVVYAVGQGAVAVGGFLGGVEGPGGATVQQNHPTVGMIPGGAIVEREIPIEFTRDGSVELNLLNSDFGTAVKLADGINRFFPGTAKALDSTSVNVLVPEQFRGQEVNFIAAIGQIDVEPDVKARVIINERTGTIVATANVRVSTVAVSHGSLTITIAQNQNVSQPEPFSEGETAVTGSAQVDVTEVQGGFQIVEEFPTIERVASALNALGVSTREMMSILQSMKEAGALQAELVLN